MRPLIAAEPMFAPPQAGDGVGIDLNRRGVLGGGSSAYEKGQDRRWTRRESVFGSFKYSSLPGLLFISVSYDFVNRLAAQREEKQSTKSHELKRTKEITVSLGRPALRSVRSSTVTFASIFFVGYLCLN